MQMIPAVYATGGARRLRALYPLISPDAATTWIDVAMAGVWEGHAAGSFEFDRATFERIVANFEANPNPVPLDYEHATEFMVPAPACGWVQRLEVRDDADGPHLYAFVELTEEAARWIREGRYRFTSAVIDFESRDLKSGEPIGAELLSLALTNQPFIRGAKPIRLSRRAGVPMSAVNKAELISHLRKLEADDVTAEQVQKLAAALGLLKEAQMVAPGEKPEDKPEGAAPAAPPAEDEKKEKAPMAASLDAAIATPPATDPATLAAPPPATPPAESAPAGGLLDALKPIMESMGLDLAAMLEQLQGLVGGAAPQAPAAPAPLSAKFAAQEHQIAILSSRATSAEAELAKYREKEADHEVNILVESGRMLDTGRAFARKLFLSDRAGFDQFAAGLPAVVPVGKHATASDPPTEKTPAIDENDPEVKALRRQVEGVRMLTAAQKDQYVRDGIARRKAARAQA